MTTLDHRLYAWLRESDEQRFQLAFNAYYSLAFPAVIRRIARQSRWDLSSLEEIAQDALLKFFERAGRGRREASNTVKNALALINPPNIGGFHKRQAHGWRNETSSYRVAAMSFCSLQMTEPGSAEWKIAIRSLSDKAPPLQAQGWQLIDAVRLDLQWSFGDEGVMDSQSERMVGEIIDKTLPALAAERRLPGAMQFIESIFVVIGAIPRLRVPTNAYLFEIATTLYLDECRKSGRQKRGSAVVASLEQMDSAIDVPASDPARSYEDEEFFEKFYEHLRAPVAAAAEQCEKAQATGLAAAKRRKLKSLQEKFSRTLSVLAMIGEGYTQEQTAERLGLSRNQVKYAIELVQEAYSQFASNSARPAQRSSSMGVHPYV
jgi:DNA-directed RNA polymerase specialized sigma24 family protein